MPAGRYDMYIEQGATYELNVTVSGVPNLTDYTARGQIKKSATSKEPGIPFNCSVSSAGVKISLSAAMSSRLEAKGGSYSDTSSYYYDVELVNASTGVVIRLLNGAVRVSPEITK